MDAPELGQNETLTTKKRAEEADECNVTNAAQLRVMISPRPVLWKCLLWSAIDG